MTVLSFPTKEPDEPEEPTPVAAPSAVGAVRARLERVPALPSPARVSSTARWWCTEGAKKLAVLLVRSPLLLIWELRPIGIGFGRIVGAWARWCAAARLEAGLAAAEQHSEKNAADLEKKKGSRRVISLIVAVVLTGVVWVVAVRWPVYLALAGLVLVLACDAVGRHVAPVKTHLPPPHRALAKEGVPLTQVTRTLVETGEREGLELGVARAMRYDAARQQYRVTITCLDLIEPKHLRAFERGLGFADHSIRSLATGEATTRELVIRDGDPLADVPQPDWIESGSLTIEQPVELGVSMTDTPFAITFAGTHVRCVGTTGAGKTKWLLRTLIDRLSACSDCVIWGCDLTNGPELPLWRSVIQRRAFTPEDAEVLLDAALAEIDRRMKVLTAIAEDDDPDNDTDEYNSGLGPALVILIDEFSQLATFDGKNGKPDLLDRCERIVRTGRKTHTSLCMLTQKTGNDDFGSSTMSSQCGASIMLACSPRDTVTMLGVERRDMGYAPHLLAPGVEGDSRDAGKAYLESPAHRTPDLYRCFAPMPNSEVKRRAMRRVADGLPSLDGRGACQDVIEAHEVPAILVGVESAFEVAGNPDRLATADLLEHLASEGCELDERQLAERLRPYDLRPTARWRPAPGANSIRGYLLSDVRAALRSL